MDEKARMQDVGPIARIAEALEIAFDVGQVDGSHHKAWVIDQMVRTLLGDDYATWVGEYEDDGDFRWDTGIAP